MKKIFTLLTLFFMSFQLATAQYTMIVQPAGGLNDGTDSGTATAGKDTWVNRYAPGNNNGTADHIYSSPRTNCNPSDAKAYLQFDVTNLPIAVDSVFLGVTHLEHTSYCYSNCDADFYFYRCTSDWDEMTLVQSNLPMEDTTPFFGPLNITFPNDFQQQEYDITSAYNYWKTAGNKNYGFTIYSPDIGCNNASVSFAARSSDDTVVANRPYLKIYYHFPASTNSVSIENDVVAYPNPFINLLKTQIENPDAVYLSDITGKQVELIYDEAVGGYKTDFVEPGLYVLRMLKGQQFVSTKVYKEAN